MHRPDASERAVGKALLGSASVYVSHHAEATVIIARRETDAG
jgi:nucleotide-binding universal stress UspA family protein